MGFSVRRLTRSDADLHRSLRLSALRDSPDSFLDTYKQAAAQPAAWWEELTRSVTAETGRNVMFVAFENGEPVGSTYGLVDVNRINAGRVGGMWVTPTARRHGVGRALLDEVFEWARIRGFAALRLWAATSPASVIAFYRAAGFTETGKRHPMASDRPSLHIAEMELLLAAAAAR